MAGVDRVDGVSTLRSAASLTGSRRIPQGRTTFTSNRMAQAQESTSTKAAGNHDEVGPENSGESHSNEHATTST